MADYHYPQSNQRVSGKIQLRYNSDGAPSPPPTHPHTHTQEDGHTALTKLNTKNPTRATIKPHGHTTTKAINPSILQTSKKRCYALQSTVKGWARNVSQNKSGTHPRIQQKQHIHYDTPETSVKMTESN